MGNHFYGRKIVNAVTQHDLQKKVMENEKRQWRMVGKFTRHHYSGHWCCVMERQSKVTQN